MSQFIGRKFELDLLNQQLRKKSAKIVVLRGRRRIGKSRLLQESANFFDKSLEFSGLAPEENIGAKEQRIEFAELLVRQTRAVIDRHDNWSHLFWLLSKHIDHKKKHSLFLMKLPGWHGEIKHFYLN